MQRPVQYASSPGSYVPRMRLIYLVLHVQCAYNMGHGYLPKAKLAASIAGQSVAVFSSRNTGSVSSDDVVMLRVVGTLRYGR